MAVRNSKRVPTVSSMTTNEAAATMRLAGEYSGAVLTMASAQVSAGAGNMVCMGTSK